MDIKELYGHFLSSAGVSTDSRSIRGGELFIGLKGENFDGGDYALKALSDGAALAVVDSSSPAAASGDPRIVAVPDTLETLRQLARYHREHSFVNGERLTVIGLTGTNGKTTTKNLITRVLSRKFHVTATEGNLNNDIGVPLSLLKINSSTEIAVIEMGASHPGDIARLTEVAEPDYGLITNVGKAHLLGFGSFEGVKKAKGQLYDWILGHGKAVFVNVDDEVLKGMASDRTGLETIPYGIDESGAIVLPSDPSHPFLRMAVPSEDGEKDGEETLLGIETHLVGSYNASNVMAAIAVGRYFGVSLEDAIAAVDEFVPENSRSQMMRCGSNTVIADAYNANPSSMAAALDNFSLVEASRKAVLLGDMRELGEDSLKEHEAVVKRLAAIPLDLVCLVGEEFGKAVEAVGPVQGMKLFKTSVELAGWLKENPLNDTVVLVKGSRGIQMEKAIEALSR
ncbi:MAG: UDP-N-acetylmuramoyl-tripeptide--D-alanyl-D-alanine ligase [Bacteroidales bacterium]|nr:UDP-N-acetylmuramoyl-tripeptide--D-alanyl-D-alanine ligase [Bacteroidales bacterium]